MSRSSPWCPCTAYVPLLAAILPVIAVHGAYLTNIHWGEAAACIPYWDGCTSISGAARTGPGIVLFRVLMYPTAVLLIATWVLVFNWLKRVGIPVTAAVKALPFLGSAGALCLIIYVAFLGVDGGLPGVMRRIGVNIYFGFTALALLLLVSALWPHRAAFRPIPRRLLNGLTATVSLLWALGVGFSGKKLVISNPLFLDRIESLVEWWFALLMTCGFIAIAGLLHAAGDARAARLD